MNQLDLRNRKDYKHSSIEELQDRFGSVPCYFKSYYKYTFCFESEVREDGEVKKLGILLGGDRDDSYVHRLRVEVDTPEYISGVGTIILQRQDPKTQEWYQAEYFRSDDLY